MLWATFRNLSIATIAIFPIGYPVSFAEVPTKPPLAVKGSKPVEIEGFALGWHPTQGSMYRIKLKDDTRWSRWVFVSSSDLAALDAIFKRRAYLHPNGWISGDPERVND